MRRLEKIKTIGVSPRINKETHVVPNDVPALTPHQIMKAKKMTNKPSRSATPKGRGTNKPKVTRPTRPTRPTGKPDAVVKSFSVAPHTGEGRGERILIYGKPGRGKSTAAALIEGAIFVPIDSLGKKFKNVLTDEDVMKAQGVENFGDVLAFLNTYDFPANSTIVIDTLTKLCDWMEDHAVATMTTAKGQTVTSFKGFGWDCGQIYKDLAKLLLAAVDKLVSVGHNVVYLCQSDLMFVASSTTMDFRQNTPDLPKRKDGDLRQIFVAECDHVLCLDYAELVVIGSEDDRSGRVKDTGTDRIFFTNGGHSIVAKTRDLDLPEHVSFFHPGDNLIWQYLLDAEAPEGIEDEN